MKQKLHQIFENLLNVNASDITDELSINTLRSWDSQKHMEIIFSIEEEFEIGELSMDEIVEMTSIGAIKRILKSKGVEI